MLLLVVSLSGKSWEIVMKQVGQLWTDPRKLNAKNQLMLKLAPEQEEQHSNVVTVHNKNESVETCSTHLCNATCSKNEKYWISMDFCAVLYCCSMSHYPLHERRKNKTFLGAFKLSLISTWGRREATNLHPRIDLYFWGRCSFGISNVKPGGLLQNVSKHVKTRTKKHKALRVEMQFLEGSLLSTKTH